MVTKTKKTAKKLLTHKDIEIGSFGQKVETPVETVTVETPSPVETPVVETPQTNAPPYSIELAVHEILLGTEMTGRAESGFITAIYNDEDWQASRIIDRETKMPTDRWHYPWRAYWNAPPRNTDKRGKRIPNSPDTRAQLANLFLLRFPEYADIAALLTAATADKAAAAKAKNGGKVETAKFAIAKHKKKIDSALAMFTRAMMSVYLLREEMKPTSVQLGEHNEIKVSGCTIDTDNGDFKSSALRKRGDTLLKKLGKIQTEERDTDPGTTNAPPVINAVTASTVIDGLVDMLEKNKSPIAVDSEETETVLTKVKLATLAYTSIRSITREDTTNEELHGTVSLIVNDLLNVLGATSIGEVRKIAKAFNQG